MLTIVEEVVLIHVPDDVLTQDLLKQLNDVQCKSNWSIAGWSSATFAFFVDWCYDGLHHAGIKLASRHPRQN